MNQKLHPRVGVGAFLLNEQGELLLVRRKKAPEQAHLESPRWKSGMDGNSRRYSCQGDSRRGRVRN